MKMDAVLKVTGLKKHFPVGKNLLLRAVDGVDLAVRRGETLGLVGESGSGKSTVAYTIIGMYQPTAGTIELEGKAIAGTAVKRTLAQKGAIQIVFQDPGSSLNPRRTIAQSLGLPLRLHRKVSSRDLPGKVAELLTLVGLPPDYKDRNPHSVGGGERQLVAVARALAANPTVMVLDEPTSALDVSIQAKVITRLAELQSRLGLSYLFITHDLSLMRNVADRVAIMYLGKVSELAPTADFFRDPLHPYTRMLLSAIPVVTAAEEELKPRKILSRGEIPSPVNVPPGCSFGPRCPEAMPVCGKVGPEMVQVSDTHWARCHLYGTADGRAAPSLPA
jgi:oligopeptide/dipeptide ABC transporter ATP-binding protein